MSDNLGTQQADHNEPSRHRASRGRRRAGASPARAATIAAAAVSLFAATRAARADTATWTGAAGDSLWITGGNWGAGVAPGSTAGAAGSSADVAVFTTPGGTGNEVIP